MNTWPNHSDVLVNKNVGSYRLSIHESRILNFSKSVINASYDLVVDVTFSMVLLARLVYHRFGMIQV